MDGWMSSTVSSVAISVEVVIMMITIIITRSWRFGEEMSVAHMCHDYDVFSCVPTPPTHIPIVRLLVAVTITHTIFIISFSVLRFDEFSHSSVSVIIPFVGGWSAPALLVNPHLNVSSLEFKSEIGR